MENKIQMSGPGSYHVVSAPPKEEQHSDLSINCTLQGLLEFMEKRKEDIFHCDSSADQGVHVLVEQKDGIAVTLRMREHGAFMPAFGKRIPSTTVCGSLYHSKDYADVKKMMESAWASDALSLWVRKRRHLFADEGSWRTLWGKLGSMTHHISRITEAHSDFATRKKGFEEKILNAEPVKWEMSYPIYVGDNKTSMTFEILPEIENGNVVFSVICDTMEMTERDLSEKKLSETIQAMRTILGDSIPIIIA